MTQYIFYMFLVTNSMFLVANKNSPKPRLYSHNVSFLLSDNTKQPSQDKTEK